MAQPFHPEELALLAAIHSEPKDYTPRLVYADWLDENGQPDYAEFIRLQCGHRGTIIAGEEKRHYITDRERELLKRFRQTWCRPLTRQLRLFAYQGGLPVIQFRMDGDSPYSRLESLTPDDFSKILGAINPRGRFALLLCESPLLGDLLQHELIGRAVILGITTGRGHFQRVGRRGVTDDTIIALDRCPYLERLWNVQLDHADEDTLERARSILEPRARVSDNVSIRLTSSLYH